MTLLNWEMTPHHVVILSDTLCLSGEDKRPRSFMTKVYPAPHMGAVITGTGISKVVTDFYVRAVAEMIVNDVVHLSEFAPTRCGPSGQSWTICCPRMRLPQSTRSGSRSTMASSPASPIARRRISRPSSCDAGSV